MRKKNHNPFVEPPSRPTASINVTPLVDVVLVLLIIFMVVTPLLDKDVTVAVPKTEQVEDPQEVPDAQLLVRLAKDGKLFLNDKELSRDAYVAELKKQMDLRVDTSKVIFLDADDDANYGRMVEAIDLAKAAGVLEIGMSTDDLEKPGKKTP
ncbi:MAG: biopolymer transporter ExbD [Myxococcales bacterium]|nr:biopolymer transporter ExbD [Myxococcales bacterium]MCB9736232.1 biopolymer transporter ExbD [Deltaproteobacteria bacterium]